MPRKGEREALGLGRLARSAEAGPQQPPPQRQGRRREAPDRGRTSLALARQPRNLGRSRLGRERDRRKPDDERRKPDDERLKLEESVPEPGCELRKVARGRLEPEHETHGVEIPWLEVG